MNVLVADKLDPAAVAGLQALGCDVTVEPDLAPETLPEALGRVQPAALIVRSTKVPADAIASFDGLKLIVRAGAGYDTIDTAAATAHDVAVCNCPGTNSVAVAELAFGLLLACDRRIPTQTQQLKDGVWNKKAFSKARGLKGMTLGVVGGGAIAREVCTRAIAFGMSPVVHSRSMTDDRAAAMGAANGGTSRADLLTMLQSCDAVSMHVAATADTKGMCDAEFFGAMQDGAYFINTTRGSVVDESALADAVQNKGIRAGLDVFEAEPGSGDEPWTCAIAQLDGVFSTHHVGASTDQAQGAVGDEVIRVVSVYNETGRFENRVND